MMNEDQYPVVRKSSNGCFWTILVAIALVIATGVIVFMCHEPIAKILRRKTNQFALILQRQLNMYQRYKKFSNLEKT